MKVNVINPVKIYWRDGIIDTDIYSADLPDGELVRILKEATPLVPITKTNISPLVQTIKELTGGCECMCHLGVGTKTTCEHCQKTPVPMVEVEKVIEDLTQMHEGIAIIELGCRSKGNHITMSIINDVVKLVVAKYQAMKGK